MNPDQNYQMPPTGPLNPQVPPQPIPTNPQYPQATPPIASPQQPATQAAQNTTKEDKTSTQSTLMLSEIRDGIVVMKDGSFRAIITCKSINFDLMSDTEREGVEYSYQNFLNSLNFTAQILIRSQRVDIGPYLDRLTKIRRDNDNMLLGILMDDYIEFITTLSREANIMDKSFFIVIPYYSTTTGEKVIEKSKGFFKDLFAGNKGQTVTKIDRATYEKAVAELSKRSDLVINGLFQMGIQAVRLNTKQIGELFYNFNNPDTANREQLVDFSQIATTYTTKGDKK